MRPGDIGSEILYSVMRLYEARTHTLIFLASELELVQESVQELVLELMLEVVLELVLESAKSSAESAESSTDCMIVVLQPALNMFDNCQTIAFGQWESADYWNRLSQIQRAGKGLITFALQTVF